VGPSRGLSIIIILTSLLYDDILIVKYVYIIFIKLYIVADNIIIICMYIFLILRTNTHTHTHTHTHYTIVRTQLFVKTKDKIIISLMRMDNYHIRCMYYYYI